MNRNAKRLMIALIVAGLGLMLWGQQADNTTAVIFGIIIASLGGIVGRMQREDDASGH